MVDRRLDGLAAWQEAAASTLTLAPRIAAGGERRSRVVAPTGTALLMGPGGGGRAPCRVASMEQMEQPAEAAIAVGLTGHPPVVPAPRDVEIDSGCGRTLDIGIGARQGEPS